jgi:hypothetical protein
VSFMTKLRVSDRHSPKHSQLLSGGPEVRIGVNNGNYFRFGMERFVGFELRRSDSTPMLQAADVLAGVMRAGAEDALLTDWSRMVDLRATFEELIVEGSYGEVPHFMLSQPMFERLVHPQLARDVTTRARLLRDPL